MYLAGHTAESARTEYVGALLAGGPDSYLTAGTALAIYGVLEEAETDIHVAVVVGQRRSRGRILMHRTRLHHPDDFGTFDGLRITSPARAVLDYAEYATPGRLSRVINQLHVEGLATPQDLWDILARATGRHGAALVKATLLRHEGPARFRSGGEQIALALLKRARLPKPEVNATVEGKEVDFLYRAAKVVIEIDGGSSHGTPAAVDRDRRKDAYLRSLGYLVLRYSYWQIEEEPEAVVAEVADKLRSRSS